MGYMTQLKYVSDMINLMGDFPLLEGPVERDGDILRYASSDVEVVCRFETHSSGVILRHDSVKNISDRTLTLRTAQSRFTFNAGEHEIYTQYNEHNLEGQSGWQPLITEVALRGSESRCSANAAPFAALWNLQNNRGMAFHVFDGCLWRINFRKHYTQPQVRKNVIVEIGLDNSNFSYPLQPGETLELPTIAFYPFRNKTDMDAYKFHRYCNETFMQKPLPAIYNTWMSKFDFITFDILCQQLEKAAAMGMEYFVIDAGWFGEPYKWYSKVGDWSECMEAGIAGRMKEFADRVRKAGLKFGLWFEVERAALASQAYAAHPEYYTVENDRGMLDFGNPKAVEYIYNAVVENIEKYGIEFIKFDHNAVLTYDKRNASLLHYFRGYGDFIRRLKERYPDLYMEGCASGGMRIAPSTLKYFDSYWLTDNQNIHEQMDIFTQALIRMPCRALETWATVQTLPGFVPHPKGEVTDRLLTGCGNWRKLESVETEYLLNAMVGGPISVSCDLTILNEEVLQGMTDLVAEFKQERRFWNNAECHILTYTPSLIVLQFCNPDLKELKIYAYTRRNEQNGVDVYPVCDPNAVYTWGEDKQRTGQQLMDEGMFLPLRKAKNVSTKRILKAK